MMYAEKTLRGLARSLCALVLVMAIFCLVGMIAGGKDVVSGIEASAQSYGSEDSGYDETETVTETTQPESTTASQAHAWVMQVAGVPYYYNWEIQNDGIQNDRNFGKNLWSDTLTAEEAFKLFMTHMSTDPRACAATALGLSKELGFSVMSDEQSIVNETDRVNAAASHYATDHDYWQADFNTMMSAVYELKYGIEDIGEYSSACYMIFNGYDAPPTVIVSPSVRTGGHALVFYKQDGGKIRFRLECSFQLVDILIVSEDEPEPDIPETTTTPATTTTSATTTTVETTTTTVSTTTVETTQPTTESTTVATTESTTQPTTTETTQATTESTTQPTTTSTTPSTTVSTTTTTLATTESTTPETTTSTAVSTTESTTTESTTASTTESTTESTTTSTTTLVTTTSTTTTSRTTTETTTTQPETTTTLESKDPEQAPDVTDDADIGGDTGSDDVGTDATPEPDLPGAPTTSANSSASVSGASASGAEQAPAQTASTGLPKTNATLPPRDGMAVVQQVLEALQ